MVSEIAEVAEVAAEVPEDAKKDENAKCSIRRDNDTRRTGGEGGGRSTVGLVDEVTIEERSLRIRAPKRMSFRQLRESIDFRHEVAPRVLPLGRI